MSGSQKNWTLFWSAALGSYPIVWNGPSENPIGRIPEYFPSSFLSLENPFREILQKSGKRRSVAKGSQSKRTARVRISLNKNREREMAGSFTWPVRRRPCPKSKTRFYGHLSGGTFKGEPTGSTGLVAFFADRYLILRMAPLTDNRSSRTGKTYSKEDAAMFPVKT